MSEESKEVDPPVTAEDKPENDQEQGEAREPGTTASAKKKKSKAKKIKDALSSSSSSKDADKSSPKLSEMKVGSLDQKQITEILDSNAALKAQTQGMTPAALQKLMKDMSVADLLTGASAGGKNAKDMASHAFWKTQPVMSFEEMKERNITEGPIKEVDIDKVPKDPAPLGPQGFEWVTVNLDDEKELEEVYDLLCNHYVEDDEAMFRFAYSKSFLNWALKAPGWRKEWHVGVRASQSKKLVAFISGIPVDLRVRNAVVKCSEINYLVVHKKLRSKRLAPVLIKEITRRCYQVGIFQAIYTAGVMLPTPVATCRYFHRSLDWEKLYDLGFSPMPPGSTRQRQVLKYKLPPQTSTSGLRQMTRADCTAVLELLKRYLERFSMAQIFTIEEVEHWLLHDDARAPDQVVWSYVVEEGEGENKKITDFFSFYRLESTALASKDHQLVRAAYLFYYATEAVFDRDKSKLKGRLNQLMKDALILAKKAKFDVFNALTLLDNPLFLEEQKFGGGDGQLHYYLYNYRAAPIPGGINTKLQLDEKAMGGVGMVML